MIKPGARQPNGLRTCRTEGFARCTGSSQGSWFGPLPPTLQSGLPPAELEVTFVPRMMKRASELVTGQCSAKGYNGQVAGSENDIAVPELDGGFTFDQDEGLVLVVVGMPLCGSCALGDFDEFHVRLVRRLLSSEFGEAFEPIGDTDLIVHRVLSTRLQDPAIYQRPRHGHEPFQD